jgi:hypothetical protein
VEAQDLILRRRPHAYRHLARRAVVQQFWAQQQAVAKSRDPDS